MSDINLDTILRDEDFTTIFVKRDTNISISELVSDIQEEIKTNIITEFGLSQIYDNYKDGGMMTTVHNARQGIFAEEEDRERFERTFNRKDYEGRAIIKVDKKTGETVKTDRTMRGLRKEAFQKNETITDGYTGNKLRKDGSAHLDHIQSAKEIHDDDYLRLHSSKDELNDLATSDENLTFTNSSLNQSKGEHDLEEWKERRQKKQEKINKERFGIDEILTKEKNKKARKHIKKEKDKTIAKAYTKNVSKEGTKRGINQAKKQIIGILIYEINHIVSSSISPVIVRWNEYSNTQARIVDIKRYMNESFKAAKNNLINIGKKLITGASSSFIGGILSTLFETIINTFVTTTSQFGKLLNDSISSILQASKVIFSSDPTLTKKDKLREGMKIIGSAVAASLGVIISRSVTSYIASNPLNPLSPYAEEIGIGVGILITGFLVPTFIYTIENFGEITKKIIDTFSLMKYGATVSVMAIEKEYQNVTKQVDDVYYEILVSIYKKYKELNKVQKMISDFRLLAEVQFENSLDYANTWNVSDEKIIKNKNEIDKFFLE